MNRTIDVFELAREAGSFEARLAVADLPRLASMLAGSEGALACRLSGRLDALGRCAADLQLSAQLSLTCDRCAQPFQWPLDAAAGFYFVAQAAELDALPIRVEGDEPLVGSRHFDWVELAEDQAILSLPISPRHDRCERPASVAPEEMSSEAPPHPFAVLGSLKRGRTDVK